MVRRPATGRWAPLPVEVAVDGARHVRRIPGISVTRVTDLAAHVQPNRTPHRVRLEHALVHAASAARTDAEALALLADACQQGRTTATRLVDALEGDCRLPRRRFLLEVMRDVATGTYSVLEHRYLTRVERPHGLPTARRQRAVRHGRTSAYRDVEYVGTGVVVELDGRLGHELAADRWQDAERDIDSVLAGDITLRLTWKQVLDPCRSAAVVARVLRARGWSARSGCVRRPLRRTASNSGALPAPEAGKAPLSPPRGRQAQSWPSRRSSASSTVPS